MSNPMTQPNESELDKILPCGCGFVKGFAYKPGGQCDGTCWSAPYRKAVEAYINANYTPNTKLKALIEASEKLNLEFHGRPDCKNCALQEQLAELMKGTK